MAGEKIACPDCAKELVIPAGKQIRAVESAAAPVKEFETIRFLVPCEACQKPVGRDAIWCPNCGHVKDGWFNVAFHILFNFVMAAFVLSLFTAPIVAIAFVFLRAMVHG